MDRFSRSATLLGKDGQTKLASAHVMVVGCGGVGGFIAEFLARAGVGRLTLIDSDDIEVSNLNRQIIALESTVGQSKTAVLKARLLDINSICVVEAQKMRFCKETDPVLDSSPDYVADAIDSVADKAWLIKSCKDRGIKIISAMGAGNRIGIPEFRLTDIYKTENDGLAKALRKRLREWRVDSHLCVCAKALPEKSEGVTASISYYPAACACVLAAKIIEDLRT